MSHKRLPPAADAGKEGAVNKSEFGPKDQTNLKVRGILLMTRYQDLSQTGTKSKRAVPIGCAILHRKK